MQMGDGNSNPLNIVHIWNTVPNNKSRYLQNASLIKYRRANELNWRSVIELIKLTMEKFTMGRQATELTETYMCSAILMSKIRDKIPVKNKFFLTCKLREISEVKTTISGFKNINSSYNHLNSPYKNFILLKCYSN